MNLAQKLSWWATGLCCVAAILMPVSPQWVPVVFILPALVLMAIGLGLVQRDWNDVQEAVDLQERWRRQRDRAT